MIKKTSGKITWLCVCFLLFSSCGYRFAGMEGVSGEKRQICVSVFKNRTMENGAGFIVTQQLIHEFSKHGFSVVSKSEAGAGALILSGVVESMSIATISEASRHFSLERRASLTVSLRLTEKDGSVIWGGKKISGDETYRVASGKMETERNRREALTALSKRMGESIFYMMPKGSAPGE